MDIEHWPIDRPKPYEKNPRKNAAAVKVVADALTEFGWRQPIVVDKEDVIVVGHTRLLAAQRLGMDTVPVHVADLSPEQARAYRIMDNKSGEFAAWDEALLKFEFEGLLESGFDLDLTGFTGPEINALMDPAEGGGSDELIMPPENPVARLGDVWQCGPHRIVCGDATDKAAIEALGFDGHLMVTDPPYGVKYDAAWRNESWVGARRGGAVENDDFADWVPGVVQAAPISVVYWWSASLHLHQKPIECMERPIRNHRGDVYEPFAGSGTTIIAAERQSRRCFAIELDPGYCDVIVERWQNHTGGKAVREAA